MMEELKNRNELCRRTHHVIQMDRFVQSLGKIDQGIFAAGEKNMI